MNGTNGNTMRGTDAQSFGVTPGVRRRATEIIIALLP
jgi:hypothetical protein